MKIEVLRIGQRLVRDDRVTTHVALVSRAFGVSKILMQEVNPKIKNTIYEINRAWGGTFEVEIIDSWKKTLKAKKDLMEVDPVKVQEARDYIFKISKIRMESQFKPYAYEYLKLNNSSTSPSHAGAIAAPVIAV